MDKTIDMLKVQVTNLIYIHFGNVDELTSKLLNLMITDILNDTLDKKDKEETLNKYCKQYSPEIHKDELILMMFAIDVLLIFFEYIMETKGNQLKK